MANVESGLLSFGLGLKKNALTHAQDYKLWATAEIATRLLD
jgi:hypothetical protein